ncbi:ZP domain-containing protein-like [Branchiostoma floridae x Branchiostoma belcheri]
MLVLLLTVCGVLPLVSGWTTPYKTDAIPTTVSIPLDWRPCGDFPWDTDDVTVSCDYTYTDVKQWNGYPTEPPLLLQGRCTVTCPPEADMLVGPPISSDPGYYVEDGAYYCNVGNSTWMGSEPVCLDRYDSSTTITNYTNMIRLVGGEFYGCVELYDDVTGQWGPVRGWDVSDWGSHYDARMSWVDLACRNLGFRQGLSTLAYPLANGVLSSYSSWSYLQRHYRPSYPSTVPKFMLSQTLPQWENATLQDAIDRVVRGPCPDNDWLCRDNYYTMCLACAGERTQDGQQDLAVQVTCTSDHLEVSFPRPPDNSVQAADVQLAAPPCRAEQNSTHIYIRTHFEKCGTSTETTPSELIYRNTLTVGADPSSGGITWYQVPKILLECRLPRNKTLSLHFRPHLNSVFRSHAQGEGEFEISMQLFRTDGFRQPVTEYPVYVDLRQMIHVQIQVNSNGTDLQVFPHTCVATPSDDPSDTTRNDVIVDGCAKLPTLQFYPSPGPDRGRFGFQAFAYTSGVPTVYLHCDVLLCKASDPNSRCAQGCQTPSGRRRREAEGEPEVYRLIQGPIVLGDDQTEFQARVPSPNSGRQDLVTAFSILGACAVLAAAMFVLGVLYKARREGRQSGYRVLENAE